MFIKSKKMKKPYIKRYGKISKFTVWIVNGAYIRAHIDKEFTNFGQHYKFKFIPNDEFWIDKEYGKEDEASFFVIHMLIEYKEMAKGKSYRESFERASRIEQNRRRKFNPLVGGIKKKSNREMLLNRIKKNLLKRYSTRKVKVWVVDGKLIRDFFYIDFTEGGHDQIYVFIPENEVWIDDDVSQKERKFILLHELHERNLMCQGWSYDIEDNSQDLLDLKSAHKSASELEHFCRHHPEKLDEKLKEEIRKSRKI